MSNQDPEQLDLEFDPDSNITVSSGTDCYTISVDPSVYSTYGSSITSPCVISWNSGTSCWPTGGGSIGGFTNYAINPSYTINSTVTPSSTIKIDNNGIQMEKGTDIKIGDSSLSEVLAKLEERLNILHHNQELEDKWESLRVLGEQYRELEKELIEKEKMWKILKDNS
jgi:hypothetical protein